MKGEGTHRGNLCENSSLLQTKIKGPLLSPGRLINNQRTFYLRSGWRDSSLSGLLTVKGTGMPEQGSLNGEGTDGEICATFLAKIAIKGYLKEKHKKNST